MKRYNVCTRPQQGCGLFATTQGGRLVVLPPWASTRRVVCIALRSLHLTNHAIPVHLAVPARCAVTDGHVNCHHTTRCGREHYLRRAYQWRLEDLCPLVEEADVHEVGLGRHGVHSLPYAPLPLPPPRRSLPAFEFRSMFDFETRMRHLRGCGVASAAAVETLDAFDFRFRHPPIGSSDRCFQWPLLPLNPKP